MYQTAHLVGSRQFQIQERQRRLIENQDDHEERLLKLCQRADDVDARYGEAIDRTEVAVGVLAAAPTRAEYAALAAALRWQQIALAAATVLGAAALVVAVIR